MSVGVSRQPCRCDMLRWHNGKVLLAAKEVCIPAPSLCVKWGTPAPLSLLSSVFPSLGGPPSQAKGFQFVLSPEAPGVSTEERGRFFGSLVCRENDQGAGKRFTCNLIPGGAHILLCYSWRMGGGRGTKFCRLLRKTSAAVRWLLGTWVASMSPSWVLAICLLPVDSIPFVLLFY